MIHNAAPTRWDLVAFLHFSLETRASGKLDVIFLIIGLCAQIGFSPIRGSTVRPIVRVIGGKLVSQTVMLSTAVRLSDNEQLEALRRLDQFRAWHSLDEKRYCLVCGTIISGRRIHVAGGTRGNGPLRLSCPTERCNSIPMDWVLPTDEILAKIEKMATEERKAAVPAPTAPVYGHYKQPGQERQGIASGLRKFAFLFKHTS